MIKQNQEYFTKTAETYESHDYWREDEEALVEKYFTDKRARLLVLGCGGGRTLIPLHKKGYQITAIDIVPAMVDATRNRLAQASITDVEVLQMDAAHLTFTDKTFDYVFFPFHGIDYVEPDIYAAVKEVARVLRDDGVFIFNSHNRLFIKQLKKILRPYAEYEGLLTYRTWPLDTLHLRRYFGRVKTVARISLQPWNKSNWKDIVYKIIPALSKSTYFICSHPVRKLARIKNESTSTITLPIPGKAVEAPIMHNRRK